MPHICLASLSFCFCHKTWWPEIRLRFSCLELQIFMHNRFFVCIIKYLIADIIRFSRRVNVLNIISFIPAYGTRLFPDNWRKKKPTRRHLIFIVLLMGSTCFGHYYAHHQKLATMMLITTLVVSVLVCCMLEVRCG